jgi:hypothetical protein
MVRKCRPSVRRARCLDHPGKDAWRLGFDRGARGAAAPHDAISGNIEKRGPAGALGGPEIRRESVRRGRRVGGDARKILIRPRVRPRFRGKQSPSTRMDAQSACDHFITVPPTSFAGNGGPALACQGPGDAPYSETTLGPAPCEPIHRYNGEAHVAPKPKTRRRFVRALCRLCSDAGRSESPRRQLESDEQDKRNHEDFHDRQSDLRPHSSLSPRPRRRHRHRTTEAGAWSW